MTFCIYAITTRPRRAIRARGIAGERLEAVSVGRISIVAGCLAREPKATPARLRAYDATMTALSRELPALLPARFGTCLTTRDEMVFVLRSRGRSFRESLRAVRGRVQMTLRLPDTRPRDDVAAARDAAPSSGAAYLRQRAARAARERRVPGFEPVRDAVTRWVRDERVERRSGIVTVYHLIPAASVERYVAAVTDTAEDAGMHLRVTGPFAPYAFAAW